MKKDYPLVSIIMPNWNGKNEILECLESIKKLDYPKDKIEIIISDNGSTDGSIIAIKEKYEEMKKMGFHFLKLIENRENLGPAAALNKAYQIVAKEAKYILKLDNDVVLSPDSLIKSVERMEEDKNIGALGGRVFCYDKPNTVYIKHCAGFFNFFTGIVKTIDSENEITCDFFTGCYSLIRKEAISSYFLDKNYFLYYDDTDQCLRLKASGYKIIYNPLVKIYHKVTRSTRYLSKRYIYYMVRNNLLLVKKHGKWYHWPFFLIFFFLRCWIGYFLKLLLARNYSAIPAIFLGTRDFILGRYGKGSI